MFSVICFIFFAGFICLMNTSKRISWPDKGRYLRSLNERTNFSRNLAAALFLLATVLSICCLGWGSGIFAAIVMLMAMGCLSVLFFPFRYVGLQGIVLIFVLCVVLEQIF